MSIPKIIETKDGKVILNDSVYLIPEFNLLFNKQGIIALQFLWAKYDPSSPYQYYTEEEKDLKIFKDLPEKVNTQSKEFISAEKKCEQLYNSPVRKILKGCKKAVENLSSYLEATDIESGRDGNLSQIVTTIKSLPQIIKAYQEAEAAYQKEITRNRADIISAIDEDYEDDY